MYNDIKLEKGLYSITGKSFTEALESLDPSGEYKGTEFEGLDAYERQLKRFDIKVSGAGCDKVEKFFLSTESAVLFPEYIRRQVKAGMDDASILPDITAAETKTDSLDYRAFTITKVDSGSTANQLSNLPQSTVKLASSASALTKYGRRFSCSYEAIRKQRIEAFGVILRTLGAQISRSINDACIGALSTGLTPVTYSGSISYGTLASFWASMADYDMDVMLCAPGLMAEILALNEMKYCVTDFMSSGKVVTPYGVTLIKCSGMTADTALGLDSKCAAEVVFGSDVIVDYDKLISNQCDEIAASVLCGFSVLTSGAVKKLAPAST